MTWWRNQMSRMRFIAFKTFIRSLLSSTEDLMLYLSRQIWSAFWAWAFAFRSHLCVCERKRVGSLQKMFKEVNHGLFDPRQINVDYLFMCVRGIIRRNTCPLHIVPLQFTSEKKKQIISTFKRMWSPSNPTPMTTMLVKSNQKTAVCIPHRLPDSLINEEKHWQMCLQANRWSQQSGHLDAQVHEIIKITPKHATCGLLSKIFF